jgi:hypothetical protein
LAALDKTVAVPLKLHVLESVIAPGSAGEIVQDTGVPPVFVTDWLTAAFWVNKNGLPAYEIAGATSFTVIVTFADPLPTEFVPVIE